MFPLIFTKLFADENNCISPSTIIALNLWIYIYDELTVRVSLNRYYLVQQPWKNLLARVATEGGSLGEEYMVTGRIGSPYLPREVFGDAL